MGHAVSVIKMPSRRSRYSSSDTAGLHYLEIVYLDTAESVQECRVAWADKNTHVQMTSAFLLHRLPPIRQCQSDIVPIVEKQMETPFLLVFAFTNRGYLIIGLLPFTLSSKKSLLTLSERGQRYIKIYGWSLTRRKRSKEMEK